jgi:hypothetical protein
MPKQPAPPKLSWRVTQTGTHHCHLNQSTWVTVRDSGTYVKQIRWFEGCGLTPHEMVFSSMVVAKANAEIWLRQQSPRS